MLLFQKIWPRFRLLAVGALLSLACSALPVSLSSSQNRLEPTRTPLPTFTPTTAATLAIATATAVSTSTPGQVPPTTPPEAVVPTVTEAVAVDGYAVAEPEPTEPPPPPPPTIAPAPAEPAEPPPQEPASPAEPGPGAHGVTGQISFRDGRNTYGVGERVFVKIEATLPGGGQMPFGILGLNTSTGTFQTSWSSGTINNTFTHEDGVAFAAPGTHKIWLSICFSSEQVCQGADGDWERFEPGLDVIIQ